MKKALALVLALVLALSMAVTAFAAELVDLSQIVPVGPVKPVIGVINPFDNAANTDKVYYTDAKSVYYIAIDEAYEDIKLTANNIVAAELVDYVPELMKVTGLTFEFTVVCSNSAIDFEPEAFVVTPDCEDSTLVYEAALERAAFLNKNGADEIEGTDDDKNTYFSVAVPELNIIKMTIADNYDVHYEKGTLTIEAKLLGKDYRTVLTVISDVVMFEYEQVKWSSANDVALNCGEGGYSDYMAETEGYDVEDDKYIPELLKKDDDAAVIATTAFRAIEGQDITVDCDGMEVTIFDVAKGQRGVNFKHYDLTPIDKNGDVAAEGDAVAIIFGWYGKQTINSKFQIKVDTGYNWYTLREEFGFAVEEKDQLNYYILKNGKVLDTVPVDYKGLNFEEPVVLVLNGEAGTNLGEYEIRLDVPTAGGSEQNPNTGAESVVGVVAALAVVSVATAAAVSLKK